MELFALYLLITLFRVILIFGGNLRDVIKSNLN
jgi:hypothetical protein